MLKPIIAVLTAIATLVLSGLLSSPPADARTRERTWTVYEPAPVPQRKASRIPRHSGPAVAPGKMRRGKARRGRIAAANRHVGTVVRVASGARRPAAAVRGSVRLAKPAPIAHAGTGATGQASYYYHGHTTASGAPFQPDGLTAAHRSLPFGTRVRVTHLGSGRSVVVTINDRGPFVGGRIIDLSRGAAAVLGMQSQGVANVRMEVIGR